MAVHMYHLALSHMNRHSASAFEPTRPEQGLCMESDESLIELFRTTNAIAVIGIKEGESQDAYRIPLYLQRAGYQIVPINPKLERVLDEECYANLNEIESTTKPIDIVNVFRASDNVPAHVEEILELDPKPRAVWMQLGIQHGPSAERLRDAGIIVIQDRCIMVDHRRLLGGESA